MHSWITPTTHQMDGFRLQGFAPGRRRRLVGRMLRTGYLAMLVTEGCTTLGPRVLKGERINYNLALQYTADEQMLLNLVQLKYRDTPIFLEVRVIATQFSVSASRKRYGTAGQCNDLSHGWGPRSILNAARRSPTLPYVGRFQPALLSPLISIGSCCLPVRMAAQTHLTLCVQRPTRSRTPREPLRQTLRRRVLDYQDFARVVT